MSSPTIISATSAASSVVATFNAISPGKRDYVRLYIADTDISNAIYSDDEINAFLNDSYNNPTHDVFLAAAQALRSNAVDKARLATRIKIGNFGYEELAVQNALKAMADDYYAKAPIPPVVLAPDAVFTTTTDAGLTSGTMDAW